MQYWVSERRRQCTGLPWSLGVGRILTSAGLNEAGMGWRALPGRKAMEWPVELACARQDPSRGPQVMAQGIGQNDSLRGGSELLTCWGWAW